MYEHIIRQFSSWWNTNRTWRKHRHEKKLSSRTCVQVDVWAYNFLSLLQIIQMRNTYLVQCNPDFIRDALYERFDHVKDNWAMEIHNEKIDDFVDLVSECWTNAGSASEIIDNRLINWERWTYENVRKYSLKRDEKRTWDDDQLDEVENYLDYNSYMYDRDLQEYCSY